MSEHQLNEIIHQTVRLQIMAALASLPPETQMEFTALKKLLNVTDGNLGSHLRKLEDAGYVHITKTFVGRKPKSFIALTASGKAAFDAHVSALKAILNTEGRRESS